MFVWRSFADLVESTSRRVPPTSARVGLPGRPDIRTDLWSHLRPVATDLLVARNAQDQIGVFGLGLLAPVIISLVTIPIIKCMQNYRMPILERNDWLIGIGRKLRLFRARR